MTPLRPLHSWRRPATPTVESLNERLCDLTCERQQLRANGADPVALEHNRVAIAGAQWELSYALIERYLPPQVAAAAQSAA